MAVGVEEVLGGTDLTGFPRRGCFVACPLGVFWYHLGRAALQELCMAVWSCRVAVFGQFARRPWSLIVTGSSGWVAKDEVMEVETG